MKSAGREIPFIKLLVAVFISITPALVRAEANQPADSQLLQPQAFDTVGISALRQLDANLTGDGVNTAVVCRSFTYLNGQPQNDYRPLTLHSCFGSAKFTFYDVNQLDSGFCPHTTAMCSILFGSDANAFNPALGNFRYTGAVPQARADIYEFGYFLNHIVFPQAPSDEDIIVVGLGSPVEDWWTRGIESLAEKYGIVVVAPIGNGSDAFDPPLYPAAGANVIGVGVVDSVNTNDTAKGLANFSLPHPQHSSFGPTAIRHRRTCKPDIVAPGNCLAASMDEPNQYEPTGDWTSFATPVVAGAASLLIQKAKQEPNLAMALSPDGGNCLIKAILMNSATKLPFWHKGRLQIDDDHTAPLDYIQGAGQLNAQAAYKQLIAGQYKPGPVPMTGWDIDALNGNNKVLQIYHINIEDPNSKILAATVVWNRHYADEYPFENLPEKDADIRLELWAMDPQNPGFGYLLDYSDSASDNVEHIYYPADMQYRHYELIVSYGSNQTETPEQNYAVAWDVSEKQNNDNILWYDLNADGIVDNSDLLTLVNNWMDSIISPNTYLIGDLNTDGVLDVNDFDILTKQIGRKAGWRSE
jgi:hypothetical protein